MTVSFQYAFEQNLRVFPASQGNVVNILLWLKGLSSSKDASRGEVFRAARAGFEKTRLEKMAGSLKRNKRPGVFEVVEMITIPDPSGQTIYVVAGVLAGTPFQARVQQRGKGMEPLYVKEIDHGLFMRRVWSQSPQKVNPPMFDVNGDDAPSALNGAVVVTVGGNDYLTNVTPGAKEFIGVKNDYQN